MLTKRPDRLVVHLGDVPVAELYDNRRSGVVCEYLASTLRNHQGNVPLLSCSLPVREGRFDATAFFDGVLPEAQHRATLAARAGVASQDTFGLLARYGRDVAGALVVIDPDRSADDRASGVVELDDAMLAAEVAAIPDHPLGIHDDSELSLAGLQDKMLLVDLGRGRWGRPFGGTASTHILKVDHRMYTGVVAAEAEALALARAAGLTTISSEIRRFAGVDCLIVSRFDRVVGPDGAVVRIHQEDSCQATGRSPSAKYELRQRGGGPSFDDIAVLLDVYSMDPWAELDRLAGVATFTALIGNADAHGKNLAVLHTSPGVITLAPLYDTVPTALLPGLQVDAAMSIGGTVTLEAVDLDAVLRSARRWNHRVDRAEASAVAVVNLLLEAIKDEAINPKGKLASLVRKRARRFLA